ncbi:MAG: anti-sigma factor [Anaerolineae bacterium]
MPRLDDGMLQAYLDNALSPAERQMVARHLAQDAGARARLETLRAERDRVGRALGLLAPPPRDTADTARALARLHTEMREAKENGMFERIKAHKRTQRGLAGGLAVLVLAVLVAIPPVRALASDFLGLFRVEQFTVVNFDPARMEEIGAALEEGMYFGEQEILDEVEEPVQAASLEEAEALAGFPARTPAGQGEPRLIHVTDAGVVRFTPAVEDIRTVFKTLGLDPELMPASIDGQPFDFTIPATITTVYGDDPDSPAFILMQGPAPSAEVPEGVDMRALGEAMLQLLGKGPEEAARLAATIDWQTTLVLPIPMGVATSTEVQVDGTTGLAFQATENPFGDSGHVAPGGQVLLWQKDGILYVLGSSTLSQQELLEIAGSLS